MFVFLKSGVWVVAELDADGWVIPMTKIRKERHLRYALVDGSYGIVSGKSRTITIQVTNPVYPSPDYFVLLEWVNWVGYWSNRQGKTNQWL